MYDTVKMLKALADENRMTIFRMLIKGKTCGCKIGDKFGLDKEGVQKKVAPMVDAGLIDVEAGADWDRYGINETQMCLLNKYFNDQITACRSTSCKCKCNCC